MKKADEVQYKFLINASGAWKSPAGWMMHKGAFFAALFVCATYCVAPGAMPAPSQDRRLEVKSSIEGQVVKATAGEPVSKAQIYLIKAEARDFQPFEAITDASGHFRIKDIEPGRYRLFVERNGYVRQEYGQRRSTAPGSILTLDSGRQIRDLVFRLVPSAVITGRVLDEDGEPVPNAQVRAFRYQYSDGRRQIMPMGGGFTNDLGEYRIFGLAPGHYYLSATPRPFGFLGPVATAPASNSADQGYAQTYFPGTSDSAKATSIELQAGDEASRMDFTLQPTRAVRVRGRVLNAITGESGRSTMVMLMPRGSEAFGMPRNQGMPNADGNFEIRRVTPGSYMLVGQWFDGEKRYSARVPVEVGNADVEGISLVLSSGIDLPGQLKIEGQADLRTDLRVNLDSVERSIFGAVSALVKKDGSFVVQNLADDTYRLSVFGLPPNCYVKSVRLGGDEVSEEEIKIAGGKARELEILVSAAGGRVDGVVVTDDNQPFSGAQVVLIPEKSRRNRSMLFKTTTTDQYGRFTMLGIAPGEYKLFAWEEIEPGAYRDPDFLTPYERLGKSVQLTQDSTQTPELKLISLPKGAS